MSDDTTTLFSYAKLASALREEFRLMMPCPNCTPVVAKLAELHAAIYDSRDTFSKACVGIEVGDVHCSRCQNHGHVLTDAGKQLAKLLLDEMHQRVGRLEDHWTWTKEQLEALKGGAK